MRSCPIAAGPRSGAGLSGKDGSRITCPTNPSFRTRETLATAPRSINRLSVGKARAENEDENAYVYDARNLARRTGGKTARLLGVDVSGLTRWSEYTREMVAANNRTNGGVVKVARTRAGTCSTGEQAVLCAALGAADFASLADELGGDETWERVDRLDVAHRLPSLRRSRASTGDDVRLRQALHAGSRSRAAARGAPEGRGRGGGRGDRFGSRGTPGADGTPRTSRSRRLARVLEARPTRPPARGSARRAKTLPPSDLRESLEALGRSRSQLAQLAATWLVAGLLTGVRPCEWAHSDLQGRTLTIRNAKATNGRGCGTQRTQDLTGFPPDDLDRIRRMVNLGAAWEADGGFPRMQKAVAAVIAATTRTLWPGRTRRLSLYSARHQFAANAKAVHTAQGVSALLGHATAETATIHHGRRVSAWKRHRPPVPVPSTEAVLTVRPRTKQRAGPVAATDMRSRCLPPLSRSRSNAHIWSAYATSRGCLRVKYRKYTRF